MTDSLNAPTITITQEEYNKLNERDKLLTALESAGIDNWVGYEEVLQELRYIEEE